MKRSDLIVGEAYYLARSNDWLNSGGGSRAVVVDAGCWERRRWGSREPFEVSKGAGVLVEVHVDNGTVYRDVVPTGHLRGLWEPTAAMVDDNRRQRREEQRQESDRRASLRAETAQVIERARQMGYIVQSVFGEPATVQMSAQTLADILDVLEAEIE